MSVLIVTNQCLFTEDPVRRMTDRMQAALGRAGLRSEIMRIPFSTAPELTLPQMLMVRLLETGPVDHLIALQFPACLIRHPKKVIWLADKGETGEKNAIGDHLPPVHAGLREAASEAAAVYATTSEAASWLRDIGAVTPQLMPVPAQEDDRAWKDVTKRLTA